MRTSVRLLKNTFFLSFAQILNPMISMIFVLILSRGMGAEGLGVYTTVLTLFGFFNLISVLGLNELLVRDVAADRKKANRLFSSAMLLGSLSSLIAFILMVVTSRILHYDPTIQNSIVVMGFALGFYTIGMFAQSILQAYEKMEYCSFLQIGETLWKVILGIAALKAGLGIFWVMVVVASGHMMSMIAGLMLVHHRAVNIQWKMDVKVVKHLLEQVPTFLSLSVVVMIYWSTDIIMLSKMRNLSEVGYYSAGYRLLTIGKGLINCYLMAIFPIISNLYGKLQNSFHESFIRSIKYLFIATLPVTLIISLLSDKIIILLYGKEFIQAGNTLRVLIWPLIFFPIANLFGNGLIASHHQKVDLLVNAMSAGLNILLNYFLIQKWGHFGAAIATFISILFLVWIQQYYVSKLMFRISYIKILYKPLIAGIGMGMILIFIKSYQPVLATILAVVVYVVLLLVFQCFDDQEKEMLKTIWKEKRLLVSIQK